MALMTTVRANELATRHLEILTDLKDKAWLTVLRSENSQQRLMEYQALCRAVELTKADVKARKR